MPFVREDILVNSPQATLNAQLKNDTFRLVPKLLERDFVNYKSRYG